MSAQYQLRPVEFCDLPTLKRWRELPSVQSHLRHPNITWFQHLKWWWRIRKHSDPTCRVWAVVDNDGVLVGQAGLYYRMGPAAEVSVVVMREMELGEPMYYDRGVELEDFRAEERVVGTVLTDAAHEWGVSTFFAEVLTTAPLQRHEVFPSWAVIWADSYSTIYRWRIA